MTGIELGERPSVLLVAPTHDELLAVEGRALPAPSPGLGRLSALLLRAGVQCVVLDELVMRLLRDTGQADTWAGAVRAVLAAHPTIRLVGLSVLTPFREAAGRLSRGLRRLRPDLAIAWGGPHVTAVGEALAPRLEDACDILAPGPAGRQLVRLLVRAASEGRRATGGLRLLPPADEAPEPVVEDYAPQARLAGGRLPRVAVRTAQGCPHGTCTFCSVRWLEGCYRVEPPSLVRDRIASACRVAEALEFYDQDFFHELPRLADGLADGLLGGVGSCYAHGRPESLEPAHLELLGSTGVPWRLFLGLETLSDRLRPTLGKPALGAAGRAALRRHLEDARARGLQPGLFLVFGIPGEREADRAELEEFLAGAPADLCGNVLKVFPGTPLACQMEREGRLDPALWLDEDGPPTVTAVQGEELDVALGFWRSLQRRFPALQAHNHVDRSLLGILDPPGEERA